MERQQVNSSYPPGHPARISSNQQKMSNFGSNQVEMENIYNLLSKIGDGIGLSLNQK